MYKKICQKEGYYTVSPIPTSEELEAHYSDKYYRAPTSSTYQVEYSNDEREHRKLRADLCLHAMCSLSSDISSKSLFEVGYGEGYILNSAKQKGLEVHGIDYTDYGLNSTHPELKHYIHTGDAYSYIDQLLHKNQSYDFCIIQNVLEHVTNPSVMIEKLKSIVKIDGYIAINVPNDYSELQKYLLKKGFIEEEFWFAPPEHLNYFNTSNLPSFLENNGLKICDAYGDFPIDLYLMHPGSNYISDKSQGKSAHMARVQLDLLMAKSGMEAYHKFCQALTGVGLGRNICIIAQKVH